MSAKKAVFGIAAGFAAEAIVGALFAPARGSITRRRIVRKTAGTSDDVKENLNEYADAVSEHYTSMKDDAMAWAEKGKNNSGHEEM